MSLPVELLAREVLELSPADRQRLLSQIISSLDADQARDARWQAVAAERDAQADSEPASVVSGPEALARLRARIG